MNVETTILATAVGVVSNAISTARTAVELSKNIGNSELKNAVSVVLDDIMDVKFKIFELGDENRELKSAIERLETLLRERGFIKRDPKHEYWFKEGEADPLCPKCYEGKDHAICYLSPLGPLGLYEGRVCRTCDWQTYEY